MSGGRRTILDRTKGAPPAPLPHPGSRGQPGVTLVVPYRQADDGRMRAFDPGHEAEALEPSPRSSRRPLIKLAHPGPGKNLRAVVLRSARLGRELRWRQSARADKSVPGLIRRTARLDESGSPLAGAPQVITEMEYQHAVTPPAGLPWPDVPGYFRVPAGRIRLGVSVRTRRGRLDLDTPGIFYYPIGASRSRTGFAFSVSAPFEMNENRDQLVDPQNSDWNAWLIQEAAAFAVGLLPQRLFAAFGPDAFLAFDPSAAGSSTVPALGEEIRRLLGSEPCWPTQATTGRARRPDTPPPGRWLSPVSPALAEFARQHASPRRPAALRHRRAPGHAGDRNRGRRQGRSRSARSSACAAQAKTHQNLATRLDEHREAMLLLHETFPVHCATWRCSNASPPPWTPSRAELTRRPQEGSARLAHDDDGRGHPGLAGHAVGHRRGPGSRGAGKPGPASRPGRIQGPGWAVQAFQLLRVGHRHGETPG